MKSPFLLTICLLFSLNVYSQTPFFCIETGVVSHYENRNPEGELLSSFTGQVSEVLGDFVNGSIAFIYDFYDKDGEPLFGSKNEMDMVVSLANGTTTAKISELKKATKSQNILAKGDASSLPFEMAVGETIEDGFITVHVKAVKSTMSITERTVLAQEEMTTSAGAFDCFKISEKQVDKVFGVTTTTYMISWVAKGVGIVRQEMYDKDHKLYCIQTLIKTDFPNE